MTIKVSRRELCSHLHFVILARKLKENEVEDNKHPKINNDVDYDTTNTSTTAWTEQQRSKTIDLQMTKELPYKFSPDILRKLDMICLASNEPLSFEPLQLYCHLCQYVLSDLVFPQGCSSDGGNGVLLTNNHPFRKINIKLKKCPNPICGAINPLFPIEQGKHWTRYWFYFSKWLFSSHFWKCSQQYNMLIEVALGGNSLSYPLNSI